MTKNGRYWKIPCYFNLETNELTGKNRFYDFLIDLVIPVDWLIMSLFRIESFMIEIEE